MIPSIIFQTQYHKFYPEGYQAKDSIEQDRIDKSNKFYRCNSNYNVMNYLHDHGVDNIPLEQIEELESLNPASNNITQKNYIDYLENRGGSTGLFDRDGDITKEKFKLIQDEMKTTHSTIWTAVLSFTPEYSDKYIRNKKQAFDTISNTIDKFFLDAGFNPQNMGWTCAYHTNTDNRHCHIVFWEKEPLGADKYGNPKWHNFKLDKRAINNYKYTVANYHQAQDYSYFSLRDEARGELKSIFNNTKNIDYIKRLNNDLGHLNSKQYARQNNKTKDILKSALNYFIENDKGREIIDEITGEIKFKPGLKEITKQYFDALENTQLQIISNYAELKIQMPKSASEFASSRIDEYYNRMCNEILKHIFEFRQTEKNLSDKNDFTKNLESALADLNKVTFKTDFKNNEDAYKSICYKGYKHNKFKQELKDKLITRTFNSKEEKEEAYKQAYDEINPADYKSLESERDILNKYGLNFIVTRTNEIPFKTNTQSGVIKGDYNQYTFINNKGDYLTYNLSLNPSIQVRGITSIFHSLGLNDNKIINLCDDLNQNGLLFNLITKSGNYNLDAIGNSVTTNSKIYKNDSNKQIREQANLYESNNHKAERIFGSILAALGGEQNDMFEEMARFEKYWKEKHPTDELLNEKGEPEEIDALILKKKKKKSQMELS